MSHPRLKRAAKWTSIILAVLVAYVVSLPFIAFFCSRHASAALPVFQALWSPLELYMRHPNWPGSQSYVDYEQWVYQQLQHPFESEADKLLNVDSQLEFADVPLELALEHMSLIHDHPIELTPDTDGEVQVSLKSTAPLRNHLEQMTKPHGLVSAVIGKRVVIGPPATVESMVAAADAAAHSHRLRNNVIAVAGLVLLFAVFVLVMRRRAAGRRQVLHVSPDLQIQGRPDAAPIEAG